MKHSRRAFIGSLALGVAASHAQPAPRVYRIGLVVTAGRSAEANLRQALGELGYVEGRNIVIEARFADGRTDRLPELVAELLGLQVELLVVVSAAAALAAKKATSTVPIVFASVSNPDVTGIVASLAHPGGNITGAAMGVGASLGGKWLELLREAVPGVAHVAAFVNPANPANVPTVRELQAAARKLKVKLELLEVANAESLERAFASIGASGARAIIVTPDPYFAVITERLVRFAAQSRLPAVYYYRNFAEAGGLMSYGAYLQDSMRKAATYVDRILKGAKPADLPVQQPTRFELVINLKTAKALGITIPQSLLLRADEVIE